jgi:hypothetical protein
VLCCCFEILIVQARRLRVIVSSDQQPFICMGVVEKRKRVPKTDNYNFVAKFTANKEAFYRAKHSTIYTAHVAQVVEHGDCGGGGGGVEELCRMQFVRDGKGGKRCRTA